MQALHATAGADDDDPRLEERLRKVAKPKAGEAA